MKFELRYRIPHGTGSRIVSHEDRYDAEAQGEALFGASFIEAVEYVKPKRGDLPARSESHDMLVDNRPKRTRFP